MPKIPMRVIRKPAAGTRYVLTAEGRAGAQVVDGHSDGRTYLCGECRAILAKSISPDAEIVFREDPRTEDIVPEYRVRDIVFRCKRCGAFNEVGSGRARDVHT
jgi:hypothetical protein